MDEGKKTPNRISKSFDFVVSCSQIVSMVISAIALLVSVVGLIWAVRNPNTVVQVFQVLSGDATPTPIVITLPANTAMPTYTPLPTYTSFPTLEPTKTAIPTSTATLFVPPADGILFQDTFDSDKNPEWNVYSGKWLVANGELTLLADDEDSYKWIALRKPEWKNYILSLNINIPFQGSAAQSHVAVAVRNEGSQPSYLGVTIETILNNVYWAFIEGYSDTAIAGENRDSEFISGSNMELAVQNDTYTLRVNGREIQKITMSGYNSGGISLGIYCYTSLGCPSFDNVKVTYLP
jgi:hypothetical protein